MGSTYNDFDECRVEPKTIAKCIDRIFESDIYDYSLSGKAWGEANSWSVLAPRYTEALEAIL